MTNRERLIAEYTTEAQKLAAYFGVPMTYDRAREIAIERFKREHGDDANNGDGNKTQKEGK